MPRLQSFTPLLRSLAAPRAVTCRQHFRFSTATTLCAEKPSAKSKQSPKSAPPAPSTPNEASRAADLAAAEAVAESDSAQPPEPKPQLPSKRPSPSSSSKAEVNAFPAKASTANTTRASAIPIDLPPPKYHVARSSNKHLPIYTEYKRGGNLRLTIVRKVAGDASALRDELRTYLNKKDEDVKVNSLTSHVIVKGHHTSQIQEFLKARGM